jgi:hypothetical protein
MLYRGNLDLDVHIAVAGILSRLDIHDEGKHEGNVVPKLLREQGFGSCTITHN